jgi:hypothetical protein
MPYITKKLEKHGAIIDVLIGVIEARRRVLAKHSMPVPERISVRAQIDTGASATAVLLKVFQQLGETPIGKTKVLVTSAGPEPQEFDEYAVSITLVGPDGVDMYIPLAERVIGCHFEEEERIEALLGRDNLSHCLFVYDGRNEVFTLAF